MGNKFTSLSVLSRLSLMGRAPTGGFQEVLYSDPSTVPVSCKGAAAFLHNCLHVIVLLFFSLRQILMSISWKLISTVSIQNVLLSTVLTISYNHMQWLEEAPGNQKLSSLTLHIFTF